ncbi:MAG: hypothetical protein HY078_17070 [Elusimicrobia bacterium]|nr:hypothetical protein [Elusimicrobiota bacterium]
MGGLLGDSFNIGVQVKLTSAEVKRFGDTKNAGGGHVGLPSGYHWGG